MGKSAIEWTDFTFNPWWGCERVSPGCANCYAEALANRYGHKLWGANAERRMFGDRHWNEPRVWNEQAKRCGRIYRVFCASMADILEDRPELIEPRERVLDMAFECRNLMLLFLTKRPENAALLPIILPHNCMLGVTIEDQARYEQRALAIAQLQARYPAHAFFFSVEPMLSAINFRFELTCDWMICGGESGNRARPSHPEWVRSLRDQCAQAEVPFFFKQWGEWTDWCDAPGRPKSDRVIALNGKVRRTSGIILHAGDAYIARLGKTRAGRLLDGREYNELPLHWPDNVGLLDTKTKLEVLA